MLETAVKKMPDDVPVLIHLAKLELEAQQPTKVEHWLRQALKAEPFDTEAQFLWYSFLESRGRSREAAAVMATYRKHKGLLERANRMLQNEAKNPTNDPDVLSEIGAILLRVGQEPVGLYWLNQALQRAPENQAAHKSLAEYYTKKCDWDKAAAHRRRLAEMAGKTAVR